MRYKRCKYAEKFDPLSSTSDGRTAAVVQSVRDAGGRCASHWPSSACLSHDTSSQNHKNIVDIIIDVIDRTRTS